MNDVVNISWDEMHSICNGIANSIKKDLYDPDVIFTAQRGGLVPSTIISHKLGVRNIVVVEIKRTLDDSVESEKIEPELKTEIDPSKLKGKRILIIDDIVDTGDTLNFMFNKVLSCDPESIKTVSTVINRAKYAVSPLAKSLPINYYGKDVTQWVVFPWECVDSL